CQRTGALRGCASSWSIRIATQHLSHWVLQPLLIGSFWGAVTRRARNPWRFALDSGPGPAGRPGTTAFHSLRIPLERLGRALPQTGTRRVHHDGEEIVVTAPPEQVNHALLADLRDRPPVGRVAHALEPQDLGRHVVGDLLILGHGGRAVAFRDGSGDLGPQAGLERDRVM